MSGPCQTLAVQEGVAAAITVCCVRTSPSPRPLRRLPADHGAKEVAAPPAGHAAAVLAAHARAAQHRWQLTLLGLPAVANAPQPAVEPRQLAKPAFRRRRPLATRHVSAAPGRCRRHLALAP